MSPARAVLPGRGSRFGALSAVMNNVGALALLMPLAIRLAQRDGPTPGQVLMPLAFGSILGGVATLIGEPPNLIVSGFRVAERGEGFARFDFAPVGVAVALAGLAFIGLAARFLVPARCRDRGLRHRRPPDRGADPRGQARRGEGGDPLGRGRAGRDRRPAGGRDRRSIGRDAAAGLDLTGPASRRRGAFAPSLVTR